MADQKIQPLPLHPWRRGRRHFEETGSGVVDWAVGQTVITMVQGLGGVRAERPGGYADFVIVDSDVLALVPAAVDPLGAST